jgi:hypothetical protein
MTDSAALIHIVPILPEAGSDANGEHSLGDCTAGQ